MTRKYTFTVMLLITLSSIANAQYFGRNKVNYERFDFKVYETPHFQIYHYMENETFLKNFAELSERWYLRHQNLFLDTLKKKNPIILYNNHADFQQNTVSRNIVGVGTGGFTEGYRNRVVMPVTPSNYETSHVLGHEMIHVFQYHLFQQSDSVGLRAMSNIPMWMIEGLAEYATIGDSDPQTAMWLRSAVMENDVPTIRQMTRQPSRYFPYRYGHAMWSFITDLWGDDVVLPLVMLTGKLGYKRAMDSLLYLRPDSVSSLWKRSVNQMYAPYMQAKDTAVGEKLFDKSNAGSMNLAPAISPDGEEMVFVSNKQVITTDYFLADVEEKKVSKRITRVSRDAHIDNYSYLESAGTWSPGGHQFALTTFSEGKNKLLIINKNKNFRIRHLELGKLEAFSNPAWSPDGKSIVVSGLQNGRSDLYRYVLEENKLVRLTDDPYSDLQPDWSPDGKYLVFVSDRGEKTNIEEGVYSSYRLSLLNLEDGTIYTPDIFPEAGNTSPQFSSEGESIVFLSNTDGFRDMYEYELESGKVYKLTNIYTGISGITELSPAITISGDNTIVYSLYTKDAYNLYRVNLDDLHKAEIDPGFSDFTAAKLPPAQAVIPHEIVENNLARKMEPDQLKTEVTGYKPKFKLEYIGNTGIGVGVSQMGAGMSGGVSALFSDILKRNQLFTSLRVNGRIYDFGGQVVYLNKGYRLNWGASLSHIPYRSTRAFFEEDTLNDVPVTNLAMETLRTFEDQLSVFSHYPLSKKLRIEGGVSATRYGYMLTRINNYYYQGIRIDQEENRLDAPDPFYMYQARLAYVGDDSYFGLTSPLRGSRYRFQLERTLGRYKFWTGIADYRRYYFFNPVGLAFRAMHYGRYGSDAGVLYPMFLGNEYYIRGYAGRSMQESQCPGGNCLSLNNLTGSKMALVNVEIRYPFSGPEQLALIQSKYFFTDLVGFVDGGLAWNTENNINFSWTPVADKQIPVFSAGAALRVNLLGYLIVQPYYAVPFQRTEVSNGVFGFSLTAGGW